MIKVTHLGEDYSIIEINGTEYEASLYLGKELSKEMKQINRAIKILNMLLDSPDTGTWEKEQIMEVIELLQ